MANSSQATKLREIIGADQNQSESREVVIHTKAQQRLADDLERASELDGEINRDKDYALRMRNNRAEIDRLIAQTEANIKNAEAERKSCLDSVHSLRTDGISI